MENTAVVSRLRRIAVLLEYQGVAFKPAAYRRAAQTIEELSTDISAFDRNALLALPGVGRAIAEKVLEYMSTGGIETLVRLEAETATGAVALLGIDDLGPKRVREIEQKLHVRTIPELIVAAEAGKLRSLPRFSDVLEKKILESAKRGTERGKRFSRVKIAADVSKLLKTLRRLKGVLAAEAAGSFRREKETVGDIDVLLAVRSPSNTLAGAVADAIRALPLVERVVAAGQTRIAFDLRQGLRVDIRIIKSAVWGSALLYFTGDKEHNITLRRRAIERGMKLSEYGLFRGDRIVASKTEEDVYRALGLAFIDPSKRAGILKMKAEKQKIKDVRSRGKKG